MPHNTKENMIWDHNEFSHVHAAENQPLVASGGTGILDLVFVLHAYHSYLVLHQKKMSKVCTEFRVFTSTYLKMKFPSILKDG